MGRQEGGHVVGQGERVTRGEWPLTGIRWTGSVRVTDTGSKGVNFALIGAGRDNCVCSWTA